ncbi:S66 peptidase family protein [Streptococcus sp. NLN64]|uniref:S66 family peptidase n=1 Tax=Streptococcus sp. NLN64 TaxID=2822799 RepID=UPI0018C9EEC6|nr:S66 peptidase family protein [Streptococcus sp. NLN64]MBG9368098.1 LD-carboxypeptidase [Streptococcus sp. NLN64]
MNVKKIGIVSLSSGILGEDFIAHELELGLRRLEELGQEVVFLPNALKGLDYLDQHPEARAQDMLDAFSDPSLDMILCAIGGLDTYRLLPHLFADDELKKVLSQKIFLGFSDTTANHLMLHKLGLPTFYGQAFLPDVCELAPDMLPYTRSYFEELLEKGKIEEIHPSPLWYQEREDFSPAGLGKSMPSHPNQGFLHLQGPSTFTGPILGGCLESLYEILAGGRFPGQAELCQEYQLFPSLEDWTGKILLLETSEEKPSPEDFEKMLRKLKEYGLFDVVTGLLFGKPQEQAYMDDYHHILREVIDNPDFPILANINVGHATPRCIIPFGVEAQVDAGDQVIRFQD